MGMKESYDSVAGIGASINFYIFYISVEPKTGVIVPVGFGSRYVCQLVVSDKPNVRRFSHGYDSINDLKKDLAGIEGIVYLNNGAPRSIVLDRESAFGREHISLLTASDISDLVEGSPNINLKNIQHGAGISS